MEIEVTLVPLLRNGDRDPRGTKRSFCVHSDYGSPKTRFVQGIADKVGGPVIYLETWTRGPGKPAQCVPVSEFRGANANGRGGYEGILSNAADFVNAALARDIKVTAMGSARIRYEITAKCSSGSRDDATESAAASSGLVEAVPSNGSLRREF